MKKIPREFLKSQHLSTCEMKKTPREFLKSQQLSQRPARAKGGQPLSGGGRIGSVKMRLFGHLLLISCLAADAGRQLQNSESTQSECLSAFVVSGFEDIAGAYVQSPQSNGDIWYSHSDDPDRTVRPTVDPSGIGYDFCHPTACACSAYGAGDRCGYKEDLTPGSIFRWSTSDLGGGGGIVAEIGECECLSGFVVSGFEDIAGIYVASPQPNGDIWYSLASDPDRTVRPTVGLSAPFGYDFCHPTACACTAYGAGNRCGYKFLLTPGSIFRWGNTAAEIEECYDVARSIASLGSDGAKARSVASWLLVACFGLVF